MYRLGVNRDLGNNGIEILFSGKRFYSIFYRFK